MKKALALVLALVMVFSMGTMAFAAETPCQVCGIVYDSAENAAKCAKAHTAAKEEPEATLECKVCLNKFADEDAFNKHLEVCEKNKQGLSTNISIQEILEAIVTLASNSMTQWNDIEGIINNLIGLIEKIAELGVNAVSQAEVKGAVADLEAALADVKLPKMDELLNGLKQKIKDLYAGEVATTVVVEETTVAEETSKTGSSSVGIALFAAVSVAAAAAYVCTKKSK